MARLEERYKKKIVPELMKRGGYRNPLEVPRLEKIVVNMGLGEALTTPKILEVGLTELSEITGQKAVVTRSRKSIAGFKLRAGVAIGAKVTLRKERMYEFLDRLVNIALPRVRDFKGLDPQSTDGRGNYTLGLREQTVFPEIHLDKVIKPTGMNVTIVTTAKTDPEARMLLKAFGMPFREG